MVWVLYICLRCLLFGSNSIHWSHEVVNANIKKMNNKFQWTRSKTLAMQTYLHVYHGALMLAGIMEYVWRAIVVINVNITMFTLICRSFLKKTLTQSCISFMFQHVTLKIRWPPHNLAPVLYKISTYDYRYIFVFWHDRLFSEELWNILHHVRSKPQVFSLLSICIWQTNVNYIAIDQKFVDKYSCFHVWVWPQHYLASVLFSHVTQKSLKWLTTYIVNSEFLAPSIWFCHMPTPSAFGIKPLFAPRCK
jgi:hypothetical protein